MKKLKRLLKEATSRGAFVIDNKGKIHELNYHGDIFYEKGFEQLMNKAQKLVGYNSSELAILVGDGSEKLLSILDDAGFIRGGIWSPSRKELYFTINPSKISNRAKDGAMEKIMKYRPTKIFVEDLKTHRSEYMDLDEFAGEYL